MKTISFKVLNFKLSAFVFASLLVSASTTFAQSAGYTTAMKKGLEQAKAATSVSQFQDVSNYFERISIAEKTQWLPEYYAALNNFMAGISSMKTPKDADPIFDKALAQIEQANTIKKNESEILALKGQISYMKMAVDPMNRYQTYIPQAKAELDSAQTLNPANPRVDYIRGSQLIYTPEQYGGGKAAAKPFLQKAIANFKVFKPESDLSPTWGLERCQSLLDAANK